MRKYYYVTTFIIMLIVSFVGITYSYEYDNSEGLKFDLIGPSVMYHDVNTDYEEYGIKVMYKNRDISDMVDIDSSKVDTTKLGEYKVKYTVEIDGMTEYIYRIVKVIDMSAPKIELNEGEEISILLNGSYYEYGYTVTDNYDDDLFSKVKITNNVDASKEGKYTVKYSVSDSSGNVGEATRMVNVVKPNISLEKSSTGSLYLGKIDVSKYSNTITVNKFNANGIYYEGYFRNGKNTFKIKLKNRDNSLEYIYNMISIKDNYYSGNMDLTTISNGVYDLYIVGDTEERLLNKMNVLSKIVRSRVGNKLVSVLYEDDMVSIKIENFEYKYDIVIDPGHGGSDIGASNGIMLEKDLNLKISKYEKCRYEYMGYRVYMIRNDDSYGEMLGSGSLDQLDRRALAIGYYGAVSRVVYSNHHNGSVRASDNGFEIIVSNQISKDDLSLELSLYNKYRNLYGINDNTVRIYSRDYNTGNTYNKIDGSVYNYINYYAVIRIPYELYNVNNVIYEPIYMSNTNDFNWYYTNKNYIKVSELKIQDYINLLGGVYNSDNSMCIQ